MLPQIPYHVYHKLLSYFFLWNIVPICPFPKTAPNSLGRPHGFANVLTLCNICCLYHSFENLIIPCLLLIQAQEFGDASLIALFFLFFTPITKTLPSSSASSLPPSLDPSHLSFCYSYLHIAFVERKWVFFLCHEFSFYSFLSEKICLIVLPTKSKNSYYLMKYLIWPDTLITIQQIWCRDLGICIFNKHSSVNHSFRKTAIYCNCDIRDFICLLGSRNCWGFFAIIYIVLA